MDDYRKIENYYKLKRIQVFLFISILINSIFFTLTIILHLLAIFRLFIPPDYFLTALYIGTAFGFITIIIAEHINFLKSPYKKKVEMYLLPEKKLSVLEYLTIYAVISIFIMQILTKDVRAIHVSVQMIFLSSFLNTLYWDYKTTVFIIDNKDLNPGDLNTAENIKTEDLFSINTSNNLLTIKHRDYSKIKIFIFYLIYINILSEVAFDKGTFFPFVLLLLFIILPGNLINFVIQFDIKKRQIIHGNESISFNNVDYVQLRKVEDLEEGLHKYVLSIITKEHKRHEIEQSSKYPKILKLSEAIAELMDVSIREV
ncbi:MAG: hypothetical protein ACOC2J_02540 [bacterium]